MRIARWLIFLLLATTLLANCSSHKRTLVQGYIEGKFIYLASTQTGILKSLLIHRGSQVVANQVLFTLDPEPEFSDLQQAMAKLQQEQENLANVIRGQRSTVIAAIIAQRDQARADLIYAEQTLNRYRKLYQEHAISKDQLDQSLADYNAKQQLVNQYQANIAEAQLGSREHLIMAQQAAVEAAMANVKKYTWQMQQKTVAALKAGEIFDTFFKVGEYVPAGQPVVALIPPENIKLIFYIPEPLLSQLKLGDVVHFNCDGCKPHAAQVRYISPQAEYTPPIIYSEQTRAKLVYRVESAIPSSDAVNFHPGQPVDVYVETKR